MTDKEIRHMIYRYNLEREMIEAKNARMIASNNTQTIEKSVLNSAMKEAEKNIGMRRQITNNVFL